MVEIGDKIRILNENGQYSEWADEIWTVESIAYNTEQHPLYDEGVGGALISCDGLPVCLYEWEFEIVG